MSSRAGAHDANAEVRLVQVSTHHPAYSQSFVRKQVESLRALGVDVVMVSLNPGELLDAEDADLARSTW